MWEKLSTCSVFNLFIVIGLITISLFSSCSTIHGTAREGTGFFHLRSPSSLRDKEVQQDIYVNAGYTAASTDLGYDDTNNSGSLGLSYGLAAGGLDEKEEFVPVEFLLSAGINGYYGQYVNNSVSQYPKLNEFGGIELGALIGIGLTINKGFYSRIGLQGNFRYEWGPYIDTIRSMYDDGFITSYKDDFKDYTLVGHGELGYHINEKISFGFLIDAGWSFIRYLDQGTKYSGLDICYRLGIQISFEPVQFIAKISNIYGNKDEGISFEINLKALSF